MTARLVRYLLISRGGPVAEDLIQEALWPDKTLASSRHLLQVAVSAARAVLDLPGAERSLLERHGGSYRLRLREEDLVDSEAFEAAAVAGLAERGERRRRLLEHADAIWTGEPLPEDRYAVWTGTWRRRLIDRRVEVLSALVDACRSVGDDHGAIRAATRCVESDPVNESGHRELMTGYARTGRTGQAMRQYLLCRRALVDELGVEPSAATSDLHARILAGDPV